MHLFYQNKVSQGKSVPRKYIHTGRIVEACRMSAAINENTERILSHQFDLDYRIPMFFILFRRLQSALQNGTEIIEILSLCRVLRWQKLFWWRIYRTSYSTDLAALECTMGFGPKSAINLEAVGFWIQRCHVVPICSQSIVLMYWVTTVTFNPSVLSCRLDGDSFRSL